jgi:hypothetical protein
MPNPIEWMRNNKPEGIAKYVMPYVVLVLTLVTIFTAYTALETKNFAGQLRDGLVESCDVNGNPLREVVQQILQEDIDASKKIPASYFPGIPAEKFRELVRKKRIANEKKIRKIAPINCDKQFRP